MGQDMLHIISATLLSFSRSIRVLSQIIIYLQKKKDSVIKLQYIIRGAGAKGVKVYI